MKKWLSLAAVLLAALVTPSLNRGAASPAKGDADKGKAVYSDQCADCHGEQGEGKASVAKMYKVQMKALSSKEVQAKSDTELRKDSVDGTGKMKPVKLSDEDANNVVAFVRSLAKK